MKSNNTNFLNMGPIEIQPWKKKKWRKNMRKDYKVETYKRKFMPQSSENYEHGMFP